MGGPWGPGVPATTETRGRHGELSWEIVEVDASVTAAIALEAPDDDQEGLVRTVTPKDFL
jgi:hypothetical protein